MTPSQTFHDIYWNELAVDKAGIFRHSTPWTSSPFLSAFVFISLSTLVAFYMQARSLTRKMRPTVPGVPTRLPATVVWGLFSLQHSQLSHVQAEKIQLHGLVNIGLGCDYSHAISGLPYPGLESILEVPYQLVCHNANKHQLSSASQILSQVDEFHPSQQIRVKNDRKSSGKPRRDEVSQQSIELRDAQGKMIADSSVQHLVRAKMLLKSCQAKEMPTPDIQLSPIFMQLQKWMTSENIF